MSDRVAELESSVALLATELAALRDRVSVLETGTLLKTEHAPLSAIPDVDVAEVEGWLALLGRTLVILGGAYLLRAMTSAQVVSYAVGVGAGLLYGAPWLLLAARAGSRGRRLDAFCYGASTALIGYPLVWEATTRFAVFTAAQSALLLGGLTAAAFVLSAVWRLHSLAAIVTCGALACAFGLAISTGHWLPYTSLAIAIGFATLWLGYVRDWVFLRWPAALVANVMIVVLAGRPERQFGWVLLVQVIAIGGYLGSVAFRTMARNRRVLPFEVGQSVGILVLVVPSVFALLPAHSSGATIAAAILLFSGVAAYVMMFVLIERRAHLANLFFYSLCGLVLTIAGATLAIPRTAPVLTAVAGAAAAVLARRRVPVVFCTQAVLLTTAAAVSAGLFAASAAALTAPAALWPAPNGSASVALVCGIAALAIAPRRDAGALGHGIAAARLGLSAVVLCTVAGPTVYLAASLLQQTSGWDAAWLATLRTAVIVLMTLAVARVSRQIAWREAGWLIYPLLVVLGAKLLLSDLPSGRPVTLFIALAAYGIALITAPRALRHRSQPLRM